MARKKPQPTVSPGTVIRVLARSEVESALDRWLDAFGKNGFGSASNQYLWHLFSFERSSALSKADALEAYARVNALKYFVNSNDGDEGFETDLRPEASSFRDFYVFPGNLAWTMAFTHEDGWLGPYFAKHSDFLKLCLENERQIQKAAEAESARAKGWS